ncbi:MAG: hypothetical protein Q9164_004018 [Protoblastenia rupestris]
MAYIVIDEDGDLMVEVIETEILINDTERRTQVVKKAEFKVSREILINNSRVFATMLRTDFYKEGSRNRIRLEDDNVMSMEIWLRVWHKLSNIYTAKLEEMWHLVAACDKYHLDITLLKPWYALWYQNHDIDHYYANWSNHRKDNRVLSPRSLLFPCWRFDHAKGFMEATHFLVYNSTGHVTEYNPTPYYRYHLESRYIGR